MSLICITKIRRDKTISYFQISRGTFRLMEFTHWGPQIRSTRQCLLNGNYGIARVYVSEKIKLLTQSINQEARNRQSKWARLAF